MRITNDNRYIIINNTCKLYICQLYYDSNIRIVKAYAEKQGYGVTIEHPLNQQQSVDLHLEKGGEKTAVEISVTTNATQEIANVQKCILAGYDRIIIICADNRTMESLKKRAKHSYSPEIQAKVFFSALNSFTQHIQPKISFPQFSAK